MYGIYLVFTSFLFLIFFLKNRKKIKNYSLFTLGQSIYEINYSHEVKGYIVCYLSHSVNSVQKEREKTKAFERFSKISWRYNRKGKEKKENVCIFLSFFSFLCLIKSDLTTSNRYISDYIVNNWPKKKNKIQTQDIRVWRTSLVDHHSLPLNACSLHY